METIRISEYDEIFRDIEKMRVEISTLINERDDLLFNICKNIEAKYIQSVGALEYKVYKAECLYRQLKRKAQLIQAKKNCQVPIDVSEIDRQLEDEMEEYKQAMGQRLRAINKALSWFSGKIVPPKLVEEEKRLYRSIVKALHPDLNPDLTQEQKEMFLRAVEAYKTHDIEALRLIYTVAIDPITEEKDQSFLDLVKKRDKLYEAMLRVKKEIVQIKSRFPYTMKDFVNDETAIKIKGWNLRVEFLIISKPARR